MATEVGQLVLKVDTSQVASAESAVERLGDASQKTQAQTNKLATATKRNNVVIGDFGRKAGMAGVQFEQLAGQIAMGQNPMRALGVQAADLGFILGFPLLGAVVGISAAIASVLIPATEDAGDVIDDMKDRLLGMTEGFEKLTAAQNLYLRYSILKQIEALNDEIQDMTTFLGIAVNQKFLSVEQLAAIDEARMKIAELQEQYDALNKKTTEGTEDRQEFIEALEHELKILGMSENGLKLYELRLMGASAAELELASAILLKIDAKKRDLEQQKEQEKLLKDLQRETLKQLEAREQEVKKAEEHAARMAALDESTMEREARLRDERLAKNQEDRDKDLISEKAYKEAKRSINAAYNEALIEDERRTIDELNAIAEEREQYEKDLAEKRKESAMETTDSLLAFEDVLLKGKSEKSKAAYRLAVNFANAEKRQNAADIISKSYVAAMKAYASLAGIPIIGPALGAAAAATVISAGVSYAAQSLSGRALGGQVRAGESYIVGERGPEVLTMGTGGRITPNEALRDQTNNTSNRTTNVSFNIQAADASGFDRLLNSRRGLIIQMINEAVEDQGREAFV